MRAVKLRCADFRNISSLELSFGDRMNVIFGENAQGKTNILEAVWLFTGAKSFRGARDSSYVRFGQEKAVCELTFETGGTEYTAKMEFSEKRTAYLNGKALKSPSELAGKFNAVIFSPLDISLINGSPAERRKFLDLSIGQLYPGYIPLLHGYNKALSQRNQTLRDYRFDPSLSVMLEIFEKELSTKGEKITALRKRYLERLKNYIPDIYSGISGGREVFSAEYEEKTAGFDLEAELVKSRAEDMKTGVTSAGPHRDDVLLTIDGRACRAYGSQGQRRSAALTLKLAQAEVINSAAGEYPVCLLDDVMSELDPGRQEYILNRVKSRQTLLTCCDPDDFKGLEKGESFEIKSGKIAK